MTPKLKILANVIERLQKLTSPTTGYLYGVMHENTITILTFSLNNSEDEESLNHNDLQLNMPVEIDLCGVLFIGQCEETIPDVFKDIDVTDNPLLLKYKLDGSEVHPYFYVHQKLEAAGSVTIITEDDLLQDFVYIRLQTNLPLTAQNNNVIESVQELRKNIASGNAGFHFSQSNLYLFSGDNLKSITLKEFLTSSGTFEGPGNSKLNSKRVSEIVDALLVDMVLKISKDKLTEAVTGYAPVIQHVKRTFEYLECQLQIDTLSLVNHNISTSQLYAVLVEAICRNLRLIERGFLEQLNTDSSLKLPQPIHFKPRNCNHLLTLTYPVGKSDDEMLEYRKKLHKALTLDMTRPYFRRGNAVKFQTDLQPNQPLFNPHEALPQSQNMEDKISLVQGLYSYHHYMQDGFDDNGWGCAYRSLQTIVSWYRLQGYTEKAIPSHQAIQKCLVDIGDKPANFIGSKQWIGSTEVGFVLETLLGVTVKVLRASSGEEMSSLAPSLVHHFQNQGTPVMIGGGVLAHTILGINYNETKGDVKFLILDPHYTGAENLTTIISKGWCGWKTKDFWRKDAFYNMCLPQRPKCI